MSKEDLLQTLDAEFASLLSTLEGLGEESATRVWYGDWSVRDILAHISGWHGEMAQAFERMARGERPAPEGIDYGDPNPWNARFAEAKGGTTFVNMVQELKASKAAFVGAAEQVPTDRFEEGRAAYRILLATGIDHYREHAPEIRQWREREGI